MLTRGDLAVRWRLAMQEPGQVAADTMSKRTVRGRWTAQERQQIVRASLVAGASINEVAERFKVRPNLLSSWRRRHAEASAVPKRRAKRVKFAAVRVRAVPVDGTIEIDLASRLIRVRGIVDAGMLREVLAAAR
jgi:transposase-like protein